MKNNIIKSAIKLALLVFFALVGVNTGISSTAYAANVDGYTPLDTSDPIEFGGTYIVYDGQTINLGEKAIYIDGSLSDDVADKYDYVYNDFVEAATAFKHGTDAEPMMVYIAPYVYWIDDPDDETIRTATVGDIPYGLTIKCNNLYLYGLTENPDNVVLAVNRGQTHGAKGNYTMFYFDGSGLRFSNLTMGNYCNVDLEYPLKPELSRDKRTETITQAQLALTNGDKIIATNCNFLSRLNACPLVGSGGRIVFDQCHIECGDDALPGTALYLNCTLGFYSSKPFYNTTITGAVFLGCDITSYVKGTQYLTKAGGTVTLIDCNFKSDYSDFKVEWTPEPTSGLRCIQGNVTLNGKPITVGANNPINTIDLTGTAALNAYVVTSDNSKIYNTYNLLQGADGWDPYNNKADISAVNEAYTCYPYIMFSSPLTATAKNGTSGTLNISFRYFRNINGPAFTDNVTWTVDEAIKDNVTITVNDDGSCTYTVTNTTKKAISGAIHAISDLGFSSSSYITITPDVLPAPAFSTSPSVSIKTAEIVTDTGETKTVGAVTVDYALDTEGTDISTINWYRCDADGNNKINVSVSRLDAPEYIYEITPGDVGYHIMAEVLPKEEGGMAGNAVTVITDRPIDVSDQPSTFIYTDFQNFSVNPQTKVIPGFWTVAGFKPLDTAEYDWKASTEPAWYYGDGEGGATGTGLLQAVRGSRLLYTPMCGTYGDMSVTLTVDPCKSAGQGFGSATAQYMDVYIKMDNQTLNGYALRIERTNKFSNGVDFTLIKYEDGMTTPISDSISASCYNSTCTITLSIVGNTLTAHAETTKAQSEEQAAAGLTHVVDLTAEIETNEFGGSGVLHTGTAGANATMLHTMKLEWNQSQITQDYDAYKDYLYAYTLSDEEYNLLTSEDANSDNSNNEEASETETSDNDKDSKDKNNNNTTIIIIIIVVISIAIATVFIIKSKKKKIDTMD